MMILRNVAVRHCRKALSVPSRRTVTTQEINTAFYNHEREVEVIEARIRRHKEATEIKSNEEYLAFVRRDQARLAAEAEEEEARLRQHAAQRRAEAEAKKVKEQHNLIRGEYKQVKSNKKYLGKLGSVLDAAYEPQKLVTQPPAARDVTLELLLASQAHMGHSTSLWNPANQRYIHGIRQGIHIISLEATAAHLRRAAKVVEGVAYHGGLILFVGTRPGQDRAVVKAALNSKGCHLFERWIPGTITNGDEILLASKKLAVDEYDAKVPSPVYDQKLQEHKALKPDLVVCLNPLENYICLRECAQNNVPTIGIIDTDADPTWVTYPIPANDDSLRATNLIAGVLGVAGASGQAKRLEAAKTGKVTWKTEDTLRLWIMEDKQWMEKYLIEEKDKNRMKREIREVTGGGKRIGGVERQSSGSVPDSGRKTYPDAEKVEVPKDPETQECLMDEAVQKVPERGAVQASEGIPS